MSDLTEAALTAWAEAAEYDDLVKWIELLTEIEKRKYKDKTARVKADLRTVMEKHNLSTDQLKNFASVTSLGDKR